MIGDGELWEEAKQYVQEHGLEKSVLFRGQQSPEAILSALQQADVFIQHSVITPSGDSEGTPNSILEASACALPIVSTRHAGIPEAVVDGETGILVNEHDVQLCEPKLHAHSRSFRYCFELFDNDAHS